ncbi:siderophore-interacting protein [Aeromicrobium endophyticum]|uniref:Siderophore-interacting protein n=1 Tax=Aeromicrobium endophyticum TaxID=2292704 RepID=A0A371NYR0_9ACTN|nr:siderophore-interacting protein [Aeromicrobium endophyticum]REK68819.1 siderophore-interacting protein [Aeromicrobium endophyticum]
MTPPPAQGRPWEYSAFPVRVARKEQLSPGFVRVTLAGPALRDFAPWGLDQRIKLVLPMADGSTPEFGLLQQPTPHPKVWYARWKALPEHRRNPLRTYTPSAIRPEAAEVDVDLFIHQPAGPASTWALTCAPGDELVITGPDVRAGYTGYGIAYTPPSPPTRLLLVGDESALPAIGNILAARPAGTPADVLIELADPADDILTATADARIHLVEPDSAGASGLEAAVERWATDHGRDVVDDPGAYVWIAGESGTTTRVRAHLVDRLGVDKRRVAFLGYWRLGGPLVG